MFGELEQMQEVAVENFKRECLLFHENIGGSFDEDKFNGLLKEIDSDGYLSSCLVIGYCLHKTNLVLLLDEIKTITMRYHRPLREKMDELDRTYAPYSEILYERFLTIWLAGKKILDGDQRGFDEVVKESIPKRYPISDSKSTRYLEVFRTHPIYHTSVFRTVKYDAKDGEKWIYENHYFGVDTKSDKLFYENTMHQLARRHFTEERDILPDRSQPEYLWHYHSDLLDPSISWNELDAKCQKVGGVPLPFGPKFINLINQEIEKYCKEFGVQREYKELKKRESFPSHYSTKYWILVECPDEAENIVSYHFLGAVSELDKVDAVEAIPRYLEISLKRAVVKWIGREKDKEKTRERRIGPEPKYHGSLYYETDKDGEPTSEEIYPADLITTFEPPDLDQLFTDERENYIAINFNKKTVVKDAAGKFGISERRVQQLKKKVGEILDREEDERLAYLCVCTPGIDDSDIWRGELRRILALRYRKRFGLWPSQFVTIGKIHKPTKKDKFIGYDEVREERQTDLLKKYPELAEKLKKN